MSAVAGDLIVIATGPRQFHNATIAKGMEIVGHEIEPLALIEHDLSHAAIPSSTDLIDDLVDIVISEGFNRGVENPLLDRLDSALGKLEDDNPANDDAAISILGEFKNSNS